MTKFGAKVSQRGYGVSTSGDSQMEFSSEWPLLKIHSQGSFSIPNKTLNVTIATHNLTYVPVFLVFDNDSGLCTLTSPGTSQFIAASTTTLDWQGATRSAGAGSFTGYYYIFLYNMATAFTSTSLTTARETQEADGSYGIKATKSGKGIASTDLRDFVVDSNTRSPIIHKSDTGSLGAGGGTVSVTHDLGYEPMFYVYAYITAFGDNRFQMITTADDSYVEATSTNITFNIPYQCTYFYIVLKDPVLLN